MPGPVVVYRKAGSTVTLLVGFVLRPGPRQSVEGWGSILEVHGTAKWRTKRAPGSGSPDSELVASLTGACTVLITGTTGGTNTHNQCITYNLGI